MGDLRVIDVTKDEQLNHTGNVNFSYGTNAPFPEGGQAPVPSASFSAPALGAENLYRMDNTARIEQQRVDDSFRSLAFGGRFASTSDTPIGTMSIDHQSNELNKDIRTWPILDDVLVTDTSNGRRKIAGALRHWYSECQLTEFGVKGDFLFSTTNTIPNVAFYDHPTNRFFGKYNVASNIRYVQWSAGLPVQADRGAPFRVGNTVTFVIKANNNYGRTSEGELTPASPDWIVAYDLTSGLDDPSVVDGGILSSRIQFEYNYATRVFGVTEKNSHNDTLYRYTFSNDHADMPGSLEFAVVKMRRTGETSLHFDLELVNRSGTTYASFDVPSSRLPMAISVEEAWGMVAGVDPASPSLAFEGVQGMYIIKGDQYTIQEEDEWVINIPWFDKPKWKNIAIPGLEGNAWTLLHDLCSTYGLQFDPIFNTFTLREDTGKSEPWNTASGSEVLIQASTRELAETVEVVNYKYTSSKTSGRYTDLWRADTVYSVALGERVEHIVQLDEGTTFTTINQPQCYSPRTVINEMNKPNSGTSVYSVFDDDNLEVDRNSWIDGGGYISVAPTETNGEIKITIQAPNNELISKESSFHISVAGSDIPGFLISGFGMKSSKETIVSKTGAGKARNLKKVGTTYDNRLVCNKQIARDVAAGLSSYYGSTQTVAQGSFPPEDDFSFPLFPILKRGSYYATTNVTQSGRRVQVSDAVRFNPVEWIKDEYAGLTCAQYKALWANSVCREVNISPLGREHF